MEMKHGRSGMPLQAVVDATAVGAAQRAEVARWSRRCRPACRPRSGTTARSAPGPWRGRRPGSRGTGRSPTRTGSSAASWVSRLSPRYQTTASKWPSTPRSCGTPSLSTSQTTRPDAVGPERVDVLLGVARSVRPGRVGRVDARVVLLGEHQHAGALVVADTVGEVLAVDAALARLGAGEPHLDPVAGPLALHGAAVLGEVVVVLVAVPLAAVPLADVRRSARGRR